MPNPQTDDRSPPGSFSWSRALVEIAKGAPGGAIAAFFMNSVLARKKARSDSASATRDIRDDLMAEIAIYWSRTNRDPAVEMAVTRLAHKFSARARNHVARYGSRDDDSTLRGLLLDFNKSVTGDNFGSTTNFRSDSAKRAAADRISQRIIALIR